MQNDEISDLGEEEKPTGYRKEGKRAKTMLLMPSKGRREEQ